MSHRIRPLWAAVCREAGCPLHAGTLTPRRSPYPDTPLALDSIYTCFHFLRPVYCLENRVKCRSVLKICAPDSDPVCGAAEGKRPQRLHQRAALKQPPATTPLPLAGRTPAQRPPQMSQRFRCSFAHAMKVSTLCMILVQAFNPTRAGFGSGLCLDVPLAGCSARFCFLLRRSLHNLGPYGLEGAADDDISQRLPCCACRQRLQPWLSWLQSA